MWVNMQRYLLLCVGVMLTGIGLAYCVDPDLLLSRYDIGIAGVSDDNMYRGAYGGLFLTLGAAIAYGFFSVSFRQTSTLIGLLFMGGFAAGRTASILALGMPHEQIVGLLIFEVVLSTVFGWLLIADAEPLRL